MFISSYNLNNIIIYSYTFQIKCSKYIYRLQGELTQKIYNIMYIMHIILINEALILRQIRVYNVYTKRPVSRVQIYRLRRIILYMYITTGFSRRFYNLYMDIVFTFYGIYWSRSPIKLPRYLIHSVLLYITYSVLRSKSLAGRKILKDGRVGTWYCYVLYLLYRIHAYFVCRITFF